MVGQSYFWLRQLAFCLPGAVGTHLFDVSFVSKNGSVTLSHPTDSHPDRFPPLSILTEVLIAKDILALPAIKPDNVSPDGFPPLIIKPDDIPPLIIRPDGFPPNKKRQCPTPVKWWYQILFWAEKKLQCPSNLNFWVNLWYEPNM